MQAWPGTVPAPDTKSNWKAAAGLSADNDQLHLLRTRTLPEHEANYSVDLTQDQYEDFATWYTTTCNGGNEPFTADWLDDAGFAHHFARFRGSGFTAVRKGIRWTVNLELEIISKLYGSRFWPDDHSPILYANLDMPEIASSTSVA